MADKDDLSGQLLDLARNDLASAKALDEAKDVSSASAGFHAQQAVEKSLKAVLAGRGIDYPFTHNIALLMQLCEDAGLELPPELIGADQLTPYATALRYGLGDPDTVASEDALRWSALAIDWAIAELDSSN